MNDKKVLIWKEMFVSKMIPVFIWRGLGKPWKSQVVGSSTEMRSRKLLFISTPICSELIPKSRFENTSVGQVITLITLDITLHTKRNRQWKEIREIQRRIRIINKVFHPVKVQRNSRLSTYKALARTTVTYGSEAWTIRKQDEQRLTTVEMKFTRRTAGYSLLDYMRNEHILGKTKSTPITEYVNNYRQIWLQHVNEWTEPGFQNNFFDTPPIGRRLPERS
jgi:hypothetical protein